MPHFGSSFVKMCWALALPWTVETHEGVRDWFIGEQLWALRSVERFGHLYVQHVYCHSDRITEPEVGPLPLVNVSIEVDPSDFESRRQSHQEHAAQLSDCLLGTQVEFRPRWGGKHVTQIVSAHTNRNLDGSVVRNEQIVLVHNSPVSLNLTRQSGVERLTRKFSVLADGQEWDQASVSSWSDMYFDRSVNVLGVFLQAQSEASCLPVMGPQPPCVHANVKLANCAALIPVFAEDEPLAVVDRFKRVQGNLRCLRGGEKEVRAFLKASSVRTQRLPNAIRPMS